MLGHRADIGVVVSFKIGELPPKAWCKGWPSLRKQIRTRAEWDAHGGRSAIA